MLCFKSQHITKSLVVFGFFFLSFSHVAPMSIKKSFNWHKSAQSSNMERLQVPWRTIQLAMLQDNTFESCSSMEDIWTATVMHIQPAGLVYCPILKNMHSEMLVLLTKIYHNRRKMREQDLADRRVVKTYPHDENLTYGVFQNPMVDSIDGNQKVEIFSIVRDPFERFVTAHANICIASRLCNDSMTGFCGMNAECLLAHLQKIGSSCLWQDLARKSIAIQHFVPQAYYCQFRKLLPYTGLLLYNNTSVFRSDLREFLIKRGVPESEVNTGWGKTKGAWLASPTVRNTTTTSRDVRQDIFSNISLLKAIYEVYKVDFEMFKFEMPPAVYRYCQNSRNSVEQICRNLI